MIASAVSDIGRNMARYQVWGLNDAGEMIIFPKPYFQLEDDGNLTLHNVPAPLHPIDIDSLTPADHAAMAPYFGAVTRHATLRAMVNRFGPQAKSIAQRLSRYQPVPGFDSPENPEWRLLNAILGRWIAESKAPVILFPLPIEAHIDGHASSSAYIARYRELESPPRVRVVDPLPVMHRYTRAQRRDFRIPRDGHPSPAGHGVIADALEPPLRAAMAGVEA